MSGFDNLNEIDYKYLKSIRKFIETISNDLPECNKNFLRDNLRTLRIINKKSIKKNDGITLASYDMKSNIIYINNPKYIYHELLHLASTIIVDDNIINSGFSYIDLDKGKSIFKILNEGYTMLLTNRYFNSLSNKKYYPIATQFAYMLEMIVGRHELEKIYFNANSNELINVLLIYNNFENIKKFILNIDDIEKTHDNIIKIDDFLTETYFNKMSYLLENNNINVNDIEKYILKFVNQLSNIKIDGINNLQYIDLDVIEYKTNFIKNNKSNVLKKKFKN